jgi:hypothetical protein
MLGANVFALTAMLAACAPETKTAILVDYDVADSIDAASDWKLIVSSDTPWADTSDDRFGDWVGDADLEYAIELDTRDGGLASTEIHPGDNVGPFTFQLMGFEAGSQTVDS